MTVRVDINSNILEWAILRAGYELQEYLSLFPRVREWLNESKKPTIKQLENFSNSLNVPFGYMFLEQPPKEELSFPFFRTNSTATNKVSLNVYDAVQLVKKRQNWLREYLEEEGNEDLSFIGKFSVNTSYLEIVQDIRKYLDLQPNWASRHDTWEMALNYLTIQIEKIGIVINFSGIVGNNIRRVIDVKECRGFVIVDKIAPFMFVNSSDAKAAQMFTIIHELAHLWIGESAGFDNSNLLPANHPIELLCDSVAAEFLVPEEYLRKIWLEEQDFQKLNRIFKVSPIFVARRSLDLELISKKDFFKFYNTYINKLAAIKKAKPSGGNFYATTKKRISLTLAGHINNAVKENKLLFRDAYKITGLKGETYAKFMKEYLYQD